MIPIHRPELTQDKLDALESYCLKHWERARDSRSVQVDQDYQSWSNNYDAIPLEQRRTFPFHNASNFVVPLIRMFIDTFVARTLNIVFASRPVVKIHGFPLEEREALETYFNWKSEHEWDNYELGREILMRGNKYGTCVVKTPWEEKSQRFRQEAPEEEGGTIDDSFLVYAGPKSRVIPFEDYYCYPINATRMEDIEAHYHVLYYTEEQATRKVQANQWDFGQSDENPLGDLPAALRNPEDPGKTADEMREMGIEPETGYQELMLVECHLEWEIVENSGEYHQMVILICPAINRMVDYYLNPYPPHINIFQDYRPYPKDSMFFGDSQAKILATAQEEVSAIHNNRRDNALVANTAMFKVKKEARIPDPSTSSYPGKVWHVDSMDDVAEMQFGRNYPLGDTIQEEQHLLSLAQMIIGSSPAMMGQPQGQQDKKQVYNARGTLAMLSEGNRRQDTNIRDYRRALGRIFRTQFQVQRFGDPMAEDPTLALMPAEIQQAAVRALRRSTPERLSRTVFEVQASDAAANKEMEKQNLLMMTNVLSQYGQQSIQLANLAINPQANPVLRNLALSTLTLQRDMASSLLKKFDLEDKSERLIDVARLVIQQQQAAASANRGRTPGPGTNGQSAPVAPAPQNA